MRLVLRNTPIPITSDSQHPQDLGKWLLCCLQSSTVGLSLSLEMYEVRTVTTLFHALIHRYQHHVR
jgi:hypothetical protein